MNPSLAVPLLPFDHRTKEEIERDDVQYKEHEQVAVVGTFGKLQTCERVDGLYNAQKEDRLARVLRKEMSQNVVNVAAVGRKYGAAPHFSAYHHHQRVENGNGRNEENADGRQVLKRPDGQQGDDETQCQGTAVTHEDGSRVPVVDEERQERRYERARKVHHEVVVVGVAYGKEPQQDHDGDGPRQSVQPVDEVERIGEARDRKDGERKREPPQGKFHTPVHTQIVDDETVEIEKERTEDNDDELGIGGSVVVVVEHTDTEDHEDGREGPGVRKDHLMVEQQHDNGRGKVETDACTAYRVVHMRASPVGNVCHTPFVGMFPYEVDHDE